MKLHPVLSSNLAYGKRLVGSSIQGANTGTRKVFEEETLGTIVARAVREAGVPAAVGACVGAVASVWKGDGKAPRAAVLGGLAGAALGFGAGILWGSRHLSGALVKGAMDSIATTRDEHWLENHPINYA
jgi:hypothetical protein